MSARNRYNHKRPQRKLRLFAVALAVVVVASGSVAYARRSHVTTVATKVATPAQTKTKVSTKTTPAVATTQTKAAAPASAVCKDNTLSQLIVVSISQRHLWACETSTQVYDSAVVTGNENLAADLTPTGTYHIYGKETNLYLNGSDSTGSWHDHVSYWMPFLDNKYGAYGFHDATWRADGDFGNIAPDSTNASHGCVECPLATAKWLYNWDHVGTTVTIES